MRARNCHDQRVDRIGAHSVGLSRSMLVAGRVIDGLWAGASSRSGATVLNTSSNGTFWVEQIGHFVDTITEEIRLVPRDKL